MLQEMGFGGDMPTESLSRPGRLYLGLGACMGLMVGAWSLAFMLPKQMPADPPQIPEHENIWLTPLASERWQVTAASPSREPSLRRVTCHPTCGDAT
jgi:hypothetical protein